MKRAAPNALGNREKRTAALLLWAATAITLPAQTFTTLHSFAGADGASPPIRCVGSGHRRALYGTTAGGGAYTCADSNYTGCGTVFKITPSGTLTALYSFCAQGGCADGYNPFAGLIQATSGELYGTTYYGGASDACYGGCGTVFKITPSGALATVYTFCSQDGCADGYGPEAGLVQAGGRAGSGHQWRLLRDNAKWDPRWVRV